MRYNPRLTAPSTTDKNWIKTTKGGYNRCMLIKGNSCLPNCVGYAWGRWRELLGSQPRLSAGDAENWFNFTKDGYKRGKTPKLGAVICWRKGEASNPKDGAGHVAIVEEIKSDGTIVTSNSAYGGSRFYTKTLKKPYSMGGTYHFQGFIYIPLTFDNKYNLGRILKKGCKGSDVKELQKALIAKGYSCGRYGADGVFGNATANAVAKFQKGMKIKADKIVGRDTAHKLGWTFKGK